MSMLNKLYKKNNTDMLSKDLFSNPTCEYRGTPFWALNAKLDPEELCRQIDVLQQMGLGGFHMHPRTGLDTPYLSEEFMDNIKACVEKAKKNEMLAWLYDEDRWPSGFAGGLVTKNEKYRARNLMFTPFKYGTRGAQASTFDSSARAKRAENGYLVAMYSVVLDEEKTLKSYKVIEDESKLEQGGTVWYAYVETPMPNPWYNNQTYVNTLDKEAMDEFIKITYEAYKSKVGDEFGKTIPAIFTDEPQFTHKSTLGFADEKTDVTLPWTDTLPQTFEQTYNTSLVETLPELFWDLPNGEISTTRYYYHDHICELFTQAFADNCGKWCRENGILLTGHMMEEPTLKSQTAALGEAMRSYRGFGLPGIDMLCDSTEFTTAKQAQSAVHQFNYEGVLSELYGVTNWDFDFRGHKFQGDWQAALGVTVRVHHLSWVSMAGEAKRDYPASMNYQSPWFDRYPYVEDHFARVNTALTRGKPIVKIGVIHPVESYWLHWGPSESTALIRNQLDSNFQDLTNWLLFGAKDFDYISESLLPIQCDKGANPLKVGSMEYEVIIVPGAITLRESTVERLEEFVKNGGKIIFMGECPTHVNAVKSDRVKAIYDAGITIDFDKNKLMDVLKENTEVTIKNSDGTLTSNLLYNYRDDRNNRFLFIAHGVKPVCKDISRAQEITIRIKGEFTPTVYNTITGDISAIAYEIKHGYTVITTTLYDYDSLLLSLEKATANEFIPTACNLKPVQTMQCMQKVSYEREEDNVYILDMAEYSLDGEDFNSLEEILRLDDALRLRLGYPSRVMAIAQPWCIEREVVKHHVTLRFTIQSKIVAQNCKLAIEDLETATIKLNGTAVDNTSCGYFTDKSIKTALLPTLKQGENILEVTLPFSQNCNIEWAYLLGDFNVKVEGVEKTIEEKTTTIGFGDIVPQGLPFYGGNLNYIYDIDVKEQNNIVKITANYFRCNAVEVTIDGKVMGIIAYAPYSLDLPALSVGKHTVKLTVLGNRNNSFSAMHNCDGSWSWHGPNAWRTTGDCFSYEYNLKPTGILKSPVIEVCVK